MNYEEAREYIATTSTSGINLGLSRMCELCRRLGNPQERLSFIHIAGTNGKGSTAAYISSILAQNGQVIGRYVSPAVFEYEECIQYEDRNGIHYIEKNLLAETVTRVANVVDDMKKEGLALPTVFEIETALAFLTFCHWRCSVVVLEVGLGGREDATNVISNVLASVITPIARDHTGILGDTLDEIAAEKAGIIKKNGLVVTYQKDKTAEKVIREEARRCQAKVILMKKSDMHLLSNDLSGIIFSYYGETWHSRMAGVYQAENASLAIETCCQLSSVFNVTTQEIKTGIEKTRWRGRFDVVSEKPVTILDGAHNEDGAKALAETIECLLPGKKIHGIMGVYKDKDYETMVTILQPYFSDITVITAPGARGLDKEVLAAVWERYKKMPVYQAKTLQEAKERVRDLCEEGDVIIWFGSLSFLKGYYNEGR